MWRYTSCIDNSEKRLFLFNKGTLSKLVDLYVNAVTFVYYLTLVAAAGKHHWKLQEAYVCHVHPNMQLCDETHWQATTTYPNRWWCKVGAASWRSREILLDRISITRNQAEY